AFPGVSVAFGLGGEVSWGDAYFADANGDGLPDYVSGGKVFFNHLDANGIPTFVEANSSATPVPVADAAATASTPADVQQLQTKLANDDPLVDTVRKWTAPFKGTISIDAPVTLSPLSGVSSDGVRVAIQKNGGEVATANLLNNGSQAFTTAISQPVNAGDNIY